MYTEPSLVLVIMWTKICKRDNPTAKFSSTKWFRSWRWHLLCDWSL